MGIKDRKHEYRVLGGPVYTDQNRPPMWYNEKPLLRPKTWTELYILLSDIRDLPLQEFPLIEDFEVLLERLEELPENENGTRYIPFGYELYFYSSSYGYVANFLWWDHAEKDLQKEDFSIPIGEIQKPFYDQDQGWEMIIFSHDRFVYVMQGDADANSHNKEADSYYAWFKVAEERYLAQWQAAIQTCKQLQKSQ